MENRIRQLREKRGLTQETLAIELEITQQQLMEELDIIKKDTRGNLSCITARGSKEHIMAAIEAKEPLFYEILPLSLEEIFISETEVVGYDIKDIIG